MALLGAALLAYFAVRRRSLTRDGGSFDCSVRLPGRRWSLGVARFGSHEVEWWQVFSLSWRPHSRWERSRFDVLDRRWAGRGAGMQLHGPVVLSCEHEGRPLEVSMSSDAYTGFASWMEAAPPGPTMVT